MVEEILNVDDALAAGEEFLGSNDRRDEDRMLKHLEEFGLVSLISDDEIVALIAGAVLEDDETQKVGELRLRWPQGDGENDVLYRVGSDATADVEVARQNSNEDGSEHVGLGLQLLGHVAHGGEKSSREAVGELVVGVEHGAKQRAAREHDGVGNGRNEGGGDVMGNSDDDVCDDEMEFHVVHDAESLGRRLELLLILLRVGLALQLQGGEGEGIEALEVALDHRNVLNRNGRSAEDADSVVNLNHFPVELFVGGAGEKLNVAKGRTNRKVKIRQFQNKAQRAANERVEFVKTRVEQDVEKFFQVTKIAALVVLRREQLGEDSSGRFRNFLQFFQLRQEEISGGFFFSSLVFIAFLELADHVETQVVDEGLWAKIEDRAEMRRRIAEFEGTHHDLDQAGSDDGGEHGEDIEAENLDVHDDVVSVVVDEAVVVRSACVAVVAPVEDVDDDLQPLRIRGEFDPAVLKKIAHKHDGSENAAVFILVERIHSVLLFQILHQKTCEIKDGFSFLSFFVIV